MRITLFAFFVFATVSCCNAVDFAPSSRSSKMNQKSRLLFSASTIYRYSDIDTQGHPSYGDYLGDDAHNSNLFPYTEIASSTRFHATAFAVSCQFLADDWNIGASVSCEYGSMKRTVSTDNHIWNKGSFSYDSDTFGLTIFGARSFGLWTISANAFVGMCRFDDLRASFFDAHGETHTRYIGERHYAPRAAASVRVSRTINLTGSLAMTPYAGFDCAHSPAGFDWISESKNFYEIPIGFKVAKIYEVNNWTIAPSVDVAVISSLGRFTNDVAAISRLGMTSDMLNDVHTGFVSRTGDEWQVYGAQVKRARARVKVGLMVKHLNRFSLSVDYVYEKRSGFQDHRIAAMIGLNF